MNQIETAGEAMRDSLDLRRGTPLPALSGCPECGTVRMIAAPALGRCGDCGRDLAVLSPTAFAAEADSAGARGGKDAA